MTILSGPWECMAQATTAIRNSAYDDESNDVTDVHPSAVTSWHCDDGTSSGEIFTESTCSCITPTPTASPTSPSTTPPISLSTPAPISTLLPTAEPTDGTRAPLPTPVPTDEVGTPLPSPAPTDGDSLSSPTSTGTDSATGASEEESRWLDAAWQIAITIVAGALAATGAACGSYFWRRSSSGRGGASDFS